MLDKLRSHRLAGESYSQVILHIAEQETLAARRN